MRSRREAGEKQERSRREAGEKVWFSKSVYLTFHGENSSLSHHHSKQENKKQKTTASINVYCVPKMYSINQKKIKS